MIKRRGKSTSFKSEYPVYRGILMASLALPGSHFILRKAVDMFSIFSREILDDYHT